MTVLRAPSPALEQPLRLLLVDDHAVVREGIKRVVENTGPGWSVAEAATGFEALDALRREAFDVAVVDLSMPGMSGLDLTRRIKAEFPHVGVLMLSMHAEDAYALRAFRSGANGYLTKDSAATELAAAVRKVASGGTYVTTGQAERVVLQLLGRSAAPRHATLSDRELDVLRRIVAGQRLTDVASALNLSIKTVSTHKARIQEKLQLPTTAALIRYGMEHGLAAEPVGDTPAVPSE